MKKWFEGNPVGVALASTAGFLLVLVLLLGVVWSLPPSSGGAADGSDSDPLGVDIPTLSANEPIERFAVITDRPVFNETRLPQIEEADSEGDEELPQEEEIEAPELELAGVVITPSIRMVTLRQKGEAESLVAFEGRPLEGNFGSWHVSRIEPRRITMASDNGREVNLELQVNMDAMAAPAQPVAEDEDDEATQTAAASTRDADRPLTRAEEIRQRIAQRREELRAAEAEREAGEDRQQNNRPSYQSAIQAMMTNGRKTGEEDGEEQ